MHVFNPYFLLLAGMSIGAALTIIIIAVATRHYAGMKAAVTALALAVIAAIIVLCARP